MVIKENLCVSWLSFVLWSGRVILGEINKGRDVFFFYLLGVCGLFVGGVVVLLGFLCCEWFGLCWR